jgi:hypothetical protein
MPQWEYCKIDLNNVPAKAGDLDVLNDAGNDGFGSDRGAGSMLDCYATGCQM